MTWQGFTECHRRKELTEEEKEAGDTPAVDYFQRIGQLADLGLIDWVPHLFEGDGEEAEIIHPYGTGDTDDLEDRLGGGAHEAARLMVTEGQYERGVHILGRRLRLAPVLRHVAEVRMVGIVRLRYRPRTALTAARWAAHHERGEAYVDRYRALAERAGGRFGRPMPGRKDP